MSHPNLYLVSQEGRDSVYVVAKSYSDAVFRWQLEDGEFDQEPDSVSLVAESHNLFIADLSERNKETP